MSAPTIVYIGSTITAAWSPAGRQRFVMQPPDAAGDIGRNIEMLLEALPKKSKTVYVLCTEVWSQTINIESRVLCRVDKNQVPNLLAYEAQSLSGMSDGQARTAVKMLRAEGTDTTFWVSQLEASRFTQIADAVAFSGGRLMGVLHPAGLPAAVNRGHASWSRLEIWDDLTVAVSKAGRGRPEVRVLNELTPNVTTSAAARQYLDLNKIDTGQLIELLRESAPIEPAMVGDYGEEPSVGSGELGFSSDEAVLDFRRESDLERHLFAWSKALSRPSAVPMIQPTRVPTSTRTRRTMALAVAALAIVGVVGHALVSRQLAERKVETLTAEVAQLQRPITAHNDNRKRLEELTTNLTATAGRVSQLTSEMDKYQRQVAMHQSRIAGLLNLLAEERPGELVINDIDSNGDSIKIVGRSITAEAATTLAQTLAVRLQELNLSIEMPRCEALLLRPDGSPYEFEFEIRDSV